MEAMNDWAQDATLVLRRFVGEQYMRAFTDAVNSGTTARYSFSGMAFENRIRTRGQIMAGVEWLEDFVESGMMPASQSETGSNEP